METISADELAELLKHEAVIRNGLKTFIDVGRAFAEIKKQALYRARYRTFAEYCEAEWEMSDRHALNYEKAAAVVDALGAVRLPNGAKFPLLPQTESQARPLLKLPQADWEGAWEEVVSTLHGKLTANHVSDVVQRRLNRINGCGTEFVQSPKSKVQSPAEQALGAPIDVPDLSTKEKQIAATAREAQLRLRELVETYALTDTALAGDLLLSIHRLDDLQEHLTRKERMLAKRTEGGL